MKKFITAKVFRRLAAVVTVVVVVAMLLPLAQALKYTDRAAYINDDVVSGITPAEADNLFIHLMNEMYPVGSIYMSTSVSDVADIIDNFGGDWEAWAVGKVPVGMGGSLGTGGFGSTGGSQNIAMTGLPVTGTVSTTGSGVVQLTGGTLSLEPDGSVDLPGNYNGFESTENTLNENNLPVHTHPWDKWDASYNTTFGDGNGDNDWKAEAGKQEDHDPPWIVKVNANGSASPASFTMNTQLNLSASPFSAAFDPHTEVDDFVPPVLTYDRQEVKPGWNLKTAGTTFTATGIADTTLQPYVTCYMYRRLVLASLN